MPLPTAWSEKAGQLRDRGRQAWADTPVPLRWTVGGVAGMLVVLMLWSHFRDGTRTLTDAEVAQFSAWAAGTESAQVEQALAAALRGGKLTVAQVNEIIEQAKAAPLPPGYMQPLDTPAP